MDNKLDEIRAREQSATAGPWVRTGSKLQFIDSKPDEKYGARSIVCEVWNSIDDNAQFIAHAPDDMSYLLSEVDRLTSTLAHYERATKENWIVYLPEARKPLVWGDNDHSTILCPNCLKDLMGGFPDDVSGDMEPVQCFYCGQPIDVSKSITMEEWQAAKDAEERED